jgi:hypothetical protein
MKLISTKWNVNVSEGKRRLRLVLSALMTVGVYVYLLVDDYEWRDEEVLIWYPLASIAVCLATYVLITLMYWVVDGFEKEKAKGTGTLGKDQHIRQDVGSLATSFIRNIGNNFDKFCSKEGYSKLFQHNGPFFAWAILWLAIRKTSKPDNELRGILIESLNRVLKVNHDHTLKAVDGYLKEKSGAADMGFEESGKLIGLDMGRMFKETNDIFVRRLEDVITISLGRIKADEKYKFVPILNLLMARNSGTGAAAEFDSMSDEEFEYIFIEQCIEGFTKAQNMSFRIMQEYRTDNLRVI